MPRIGEMAPDFELPNQDDVMVRLSDLRGRKVVLFAFPKAGTPGCTKQACDFTDNLDLMYHVFHRPAFQVNMADPGSVAQISARAGQGSVVLVLFQRDPAQPAPDLPGVQIVYEAPDGVVYNNFR